jgi:hypothetical protein
MNEPNRRRNIVLSYIRDGMSEGNAVRAADELIIALEARRLDRLGRTPAKGAPDAQP